MVNVDQYTSPMDASWDIGKYPSHMEVKLVSRDGSDRITGERIVRG